MRPVHRHGAPTAPDTAGRGARPTSHGAGAPGGARAHACRPCRVREPHGHGGTGVWPEQSRAWCPPVAAARGGQHPWRMAGGVCDPSSAHALALWVCTEPLRARGGATRRRLRWPLEGCQTSSGAASCFPRAGRYSVRAAIWRHERHAEARPTCHLCSFSDRLLESPPRSGVPSPHTASLGQWAPA